MRVFRTCQRLGVRCAHLQVVCGVIFQQHARQPVDIVVLVGAGRLEIFVLVLVDNPIEAACLQVCGLHSESEHKLKFLSELLLKAQIACRNLLCCVVVACRLLEHLLAAHGCQVNVADASEVVLVDEHCRLILASGHESVAYAVDVVVRIVVAEHCFVAVGVVVAYNVLCLRLACVFSSELKLVAVESVCERQLEVELELPLVLYDVLVGVCKLVELPFALVEVDVCCRVGLAQSGVCHVDGYVFLLKAHVALVGASLRSS